MRSITKAGFVVAISSLLSGCFLQSITPLVPASQAQFPVPEGYWQRCNIQESHCTTVRVDIAEGSQYRISYPDGDVKFVRVGNEIAPNLYSLQTEIVDFRYAYTFLLHTDDRWIFGGGTCPDLEDSEALHDAQDAGQVTVEIRRRGNVCLVTTREGMEAVLVDLRDEVMDNIYAAEDREMSIFRPLEAEAGISDFEIDVGEELTEWLTVPHVAIRIGLVAYSQGFEAHRNRVMEHFRTQLPVLEDRWQDTPSTTNALNLAWGHFFAGAEIPPLNLDIEQRPGINRLDRERVRRELRIIEIVRGASDLDADTCRAVARERYRFPMLSVSELAWLDYSSEQKRCT